MNKLTLFFVILILVWCGYMISKNHSNKIEADTQKDSLKIATTTAINVDILQGQWKSSRFDIIVEYIKPPTNQFQIMNNTYYKDTDGKDACRYVVGQILIKDFTLVDSINQIYTISYLDPASSNSRTECKMTIKNDTTMMICFENWEAIVFHKIVPIKNTPKSVDFSKYYKLLNGIWYNSKSGVKMLYVSAPTNQFHAANNTALIKDGNRVHGYYTSSVILQNISIIDTINKIYSVDEMFENEATYFNCRMKIVGDELTIYYADYEANIYKKIK